MIFTGWACEEGADQDTWFLRNWGSCNCRGALGWVS